MSCFRSLHRGPVRSWNGVDVKGTDGLLQHGTVVDIGSDGLVVDFYCAGQRRQMVEYGKAFHFLSYSTLSELQPGRAVEVLLRPAPQRPWVWLSATLITADIPKRGSEVLAFVDVSHAGVLRQEIVAYEHVRLPSSSADLQSRVIRHGEFIVEAVCPLRVGLAGLLPDSLSLSLCRKLRAHMLSVFGVWLTYISSEQLLFLQRLPGLHVKGSLEDRIRSVHKNIGKYVELYMGPMDWRRCLPALNGGEVERSGKGWEYSLQHLPQHLLEEVFSHLLTMDRAQYQRVCGAWDALLSGMLTGDIRMGDVPCTLNGPKASLFGLEYPFAAPLFKCMTSGTRRITVTNAGSKLILQRVFANLNGCGQLSLCGADQVTVVASQCNLRSNGGYPRRNADELTSWMGDEWCRRLLLHRCTMPDSGIPGLLFSGTVRPASVQEDLWKAAERHLPMFDIQQVVNWVAQAVHHQSAERALILQVLDKFTPRHPPQSNGYRPPVWTAENLSALDVTQLPRVVQYALTLQLPVPNLFDHLPGPDAMY